MKTFDLFIVVTILLAVFCSPGTKNHRASPFTTSGRTAETAPIASRPIVAKTSAYYKPVPGQKKYVTGSYSGDVRLNGKGITSSGKRVQVGHLAADHRYNPVGTQFRVVIDGKNCGVWTVEDKGEAIKGPDRFDFYVGENDAGRVAAQSWGRRADQRVEMYRVGNNG